MHFYFNHQFHQTGTLDLSGPGISVSRSLREPQLGKSEGAPVQAPQVGPAGAPKKTERSEGTEDNKGLRERILSELGRSSARIASVPETRAKGLPGEIETLVDKLNATARDVIDAVEGQLPRELEASFAGGERGVYTRRLYEGRGKRLERDLATR